MLLYLGQVWSSSVISWSYTSCQWRAAAIAAAGAHSNDRRVALPLERENMSRNSRRRRIFKGVHAKTVKQHVAKQIHRIVLRHPLQRLCQLQLSGRRGAWRGGGTATEAARAVACVGPGTGASDPGKGVSPTLHRAAFLIVPSSGLYLALSSSGSDFHIWPKVHSRCELRKLCGRSGRCSWQKTV
eukprot:scaffold24708_cov67-Phaeocystis_antarctica.AAC.11